jgi:hypothetical protein
MGAGAVAMPAFVFRLNFGGLFLPEVAVGAFRHTPRLGRVRLGDELRYLEKYSAVTAFIAISLLFYGA